VERIQLNIYFSSNTEDKLGVWCENCNLKGYFESGELVRMKYGSQFESM